MGCEVLKLILLDDLYETGTSIGKALLIYRSF
jgi:hypothetical protein